MLRGNIFAHECVKTMMQKSHGEIFICHCALNSSMYHFKTVTYLSMGAEHTN